jgi:hypothetical protein
VKLSGARKEAEQHIHYLAHHDALTSLPNRSHFTGHRCNATGNDGAADPWPVAPIRDERYCKPCAGQQDGRNQRQDR